jgi:hypothetical protein
MLFISDSLTCTISVRDVTCLDAVITAIELLNYFQNFSCTQIQQMCVGCKRIKGSICASNILTSVAFGFMWTECEEVAQLSTSHVDTNGIANSYFSTVFGSYFDRNFCCCGSGVYMPTKALVTKSRILSQYATSIMPSTFHYLLITLCSL